MVVKSFDDSSFSVDVFSPSCIQRLVMFIVHKKVDREVCLFPWCFTFAFLCLVPSGLMHLRLKTAKFVLEDKEE